MWRTIFGIDIFGKIGYNNISNRDVAREHEFSVRTDET